MSEKKNKIYVCFGFTWYLVRGFHSKEAGGFSSVEEQCYYGNDALNMLLGYVTLFNEYKIFVGVICFSHW